MLETRRLLGAYEQLYKLSKYLESYMELNKEALDKMGGERGAASLGGDTREEQRRVVEVSGGDDERRSHN